MQRYYVKTIPSSEERETERKTAATNEQHLRRRRLNLSRDCPIHVQLMSRIIGIILLCVQLRVVCFFWSDNLSTGTGLMEDFNIICMFASNEVDKTR